MNYPNSASKEISKQSKKIPTAGQIFFSMLSSLKFGHLQIITPDHEHVLFGDTHQPPSATLKINDWRACRKIMSAGDIGFAECFEAGWVETPDLTALLRLASRNEGSLDKAIFGSYITSLWYKLKHLLRPNTRKGSKRNIHAHYDIGNAFYELWLDKSWTYSSALFHGDYSIDLKTAQENKYQRIIDVLAIPQGASVLEIGCGWGGFAEYAGSKGIKVHGVTISPSQLSIAEKRIQSSNLGELVHLELCDYRDLTGEYDFIVSIEMFEAVGEQYWPEYFSVLHQRLRPNGKAIVQSITIEEARFERYRSSADFIQQYIFPGGMLPSPERFCTGAQRHKLTVTEQFSFGVDYAETLRRWNHAFEQHRDDIHLQGFGLAFQRIWQMYFAYCEAGFDENRTDVIQFLIEKKHA